MGKRQSVMTQFAAAPSPTANGDASRISARGKGLTEATVNRQTSFTVDTSLAGIESIL